MKRKLLLGLLSLIVIGSSTKLIPIEVKEFVSSIIEDTQLYIDRQNLCFETEQEQREYILANLENQTDNIEANEQVISEMLNLPAWLVTAFYKNGGEIVIVDDVDTYVDAYIEAHQNAQKNSDVTLVTTRTTRTVGMIIFQKYYIKPVIRYDTVVICLDANYIDSAVAHEMTHYFYYNYDYEHNEEFSNCISEKAKFVDEYCNGFSYYSSDTEFFAEAGNRYFHNDLFEEEYPLLFEFFDTELAKYEQADLGEVNINAVIQIR